MATFGEPSASLSALLTWVFESGTSNRLTSERNNLRLLREQETKANSNLLF
jgi:hypothetical protein